MSAPADRWLADLATAASAASPTWQILTVGHRQTSAEIGSGRIDAVRDVEQAETCLRIAIDGRLGTASTTRVDDPAALVADAVALSRAGVAHEGELGFEVEVAASAPPDSLPAPPDRNPLAGDPLAGDPLAGLGTFAAELRAAQPDTDLFLHATATYHDLSVRVVSPRSDAGYRLLLWQQALVAEGRSDPGLQIAGDDWTTTPRLSPEWTRWLRLAGRWQELPEVEVSAQDCDVILAPAALHRVLSPVVAALRGVPSASQSFVDTAPLLHPALSLTDGFDDRWPLRVPVDDEGTPTAPLTLVDGGVPVGRYHTRRSAAACGEKPTGHGYRSGPVVKKLRQPVVPVLGAARLDADGGYRVGDIDELVAGLDEAVLVESLLGTHQHGAPSPVVAGRIRTGVVISGGQPVARLAGQPVAIDLRTVLGSRFVAATATTWPVGRMWFGRLPFVAAGGVDL
jgi:predicted Zn-dependent protease